ncbi:helix-turn-helix domain-containing protein [Embleya hyalina]|uniref:Transcriptional regulator n=1 Tax=Embleya hyalina TaxID=516124 RepID=A0A401YZB4_9ACTN|nr:helix-turn-helix transcriptional regulator [Embleya hyalina]GCD99900.1 transcriptional regulator [Embleya hyalina]
MEPRRTGGVAAELRRLRTEKGLSVEAVAALAPGWNKAKVSRIETGKTPVTADHVEDLAGPLGLTPVGRIRLLRLLGGAQGDEWWQPYHSVLREEYEELIYWESLAVEMDAGHALFPGWLQEESYAQATIMRSAFVPDPDDAEMLLSVRLERQRVIIDRRVKLCVTLAETALTDQFCGRVALKAQLRHVLDLSDLDHLSLRIVPAAAEGTSFLGGVTVMDFPSDLGQQPLALIEYQSGTDFLKRERIVKRYRRDLAHFRSAAVTEDQSRAMIAERLDVL